MSDIRTHIGTSTGLSYPAGINSIHTRIRSPLKAEHDASYSLISVDPASHNLNRLLDAFCPCPDSELQGPESDRDVDDMVLLFYYFIIFELPRSQEVNMTCRGCEESEDHRPREIGEIGENRTGKVLVQRLLGIRNRFLCQI